MRVFTLTEVVIGGVVEQLDSLDDEWPIAKVVEAGARCTTGTFTLILNP